MLSKYKKLCSPRINNLSRRLCLATLLITLSQTLNAKIPDTAAEQEILNQQRVVYKKALKAYRQKHYKRFENYTELLQSYPLYPYLRYKTLRRKLNTENLTAINDFIYTYSDSPISDTLRTRLLTSLARKGLWKDYLKSYESQNSEKLQCLYLKALHKEGFVEAAFQQVPSLWQVAKSQNKSCNYIFKHFKQAGKLTDEMLWQRIELSITKGRISLAKYLAKEMNAEDQKWIDLWTRSHYQPATLINNRLLKISHPKRYAIITHAVKRQIRKDPEKAIALLTHLQSTTGIPYENKIDIYKKMALTLVQRHDESAAVWLNKIPDEYATDEVKVWKIQNAIRHEQWSEVIEQINQLTLSEQQHIRWQFWWGYAHKELGNEVESEEILKRVASRRDYYGFLAADITDQPYRFEDAPIISNQLLTDEITELPGIQRAREFHHFKQHARARREWNNAISSFSDDYLLSAAKIAHSWKWYDRAISAIGKTENLNDVEIRFPLVYKDIVDNFSNKQEIDSAWTYAIIRRESIFINDAKSSKGALGLMQIMPRTARATARSIKTRYKGKHQLIKTKRNIQLGTHYLKQLFKRHNQQTVLATAAYNAGPRNVKKWLPVNKPMDAIRWIESIPYQETREYVINVLAYKIIYQHRMGQGKLSQLSQLMPPIIPAKI
ncbi:MAG: transglycosylase SLT domain-containing protein [Gammaproteobacteria bacterium]|nr:transglycosylase SLT domain-containing protein [Gammaproteobacteria bacterium]